MDYEVIQVLIGRDKITTHEAIELIQACADEIKESLATGCINYEPEEIIMDHLGLEPDYLFDVLAIGDLA